MQAKETVQTRWNRLRRQRGTGEKVSVDATALMRFADTAIHFLLAAVLAGASVFGDYAPFGVALVGAAGSGVCGAAALVGACFGYMVLLGFADGLRYAAAAILTFAVGFAFYDWKLLRRPWAMPLVAGFINSCTGFIYLSEGGWRTVDVIYFLTELVLIVASGWCYRQLLLPMRAGRGVELLSPARRASLTVLLCTVLMSLSGLYLVKDISLGRALAVAAVLAAAWQGGIAAGAVLGMAAGLSMDLAANGVPLYAMAFGLSGLAAGAVRGKGRLRAAGVYLLANGGAVLWTWDRGLPLSVLYEALLGAAAFLLLPERPLRRLGSWLAPEGSVSADQRAQARVKQRLEATAQAFRTLYDTMRASFCPPRNDNDMATVFDRAACRVCRGCTLRSSCWERDYVTTFNALNDATQAMLDRGRGEAEDFPGYFSSRCLHFRAFLAAVNEELTALLYRRQYNSRIQDSRAAVCRQYGQLSALLGAAAAELGEELIPDPAADRRLRQRLAGMGDRVRGGVFRDGRGRLRIELEGPDCPLLAAPEELAELAGLMEAPMRLEDQDGDHLTLIQQEPLMAVAGIAARKKDGETVSGDAGTYFKRGDGTLYVLLCDGMGSGPQANRESSLALRLLEQFLQAGVETEHALVTLNSALALRGEEAGGFTTVDLLQVDLFTGDGVVFKLGAAPTYVRKGGIVRRISGASLPAGLAAEERSAPDRFPIHLSPGDCVLLVSDGVTGTEDDSWLRERLVKFDQGSPKELARDLITHSPQGATDDSTALVIRLEKREERKFREKLGRNEGRPL